MKWSAKPKEEQAADLNRYRAAVKALNGYRNPEGVEDSTYRQLNDAVIEAEAEVPWWKRR